MWVAVGVTTAVAAVGAYSANQAANEAADLASSNAARRYELEAGVTRQQMDEQQQIAMTKMTDVTRSFLKAKGTTKAVQAESMVGGNVEKRLQADLGLKESEKKGNVAKEVNTNVINIAQGMLANKIDTEAMISEALGKKRTGWAMVTDVGTEAFGGAVQGYSLGKKLFKE